MCADMLVRQNCMCLGVMSYTANLKSVNLEIHWEANWSPWTRRHKQGKVPGRFWVWAFSVIALEQTVWWRRATCPACMSTVHSDVQANSLSPHKKVIFSVGRGIWFTRGSGPGVQMSDRLLDLTEPSHTGEKRASQKQNFVHFLHQLVTFLHLSTVRGCIAHNTATQNMHGTWIWNEREWLSSAWIHDVDCSPGSHRLPWHGCSVFDSPFHNSPNISLERGIFSRTRMFIFENTPMSVFRVCEIK